MRKSNLLRVLNWSMGMMILGALPSISFAGIIDDAGSPNAQVRATARKLFKFDSKTFEFQGLTSEGVAALQSARDILVSRDTLFEQDFRKLSTIHHAALVARLTKGNMFLYGPPGGAKSALVNWLMKGETEQPFKLQLHQMITEQAFIGGQNFEAAKAGKYETNTEGSLADYKVALIDETEKGNPAALSSLLSLLNEREVLAGNKVVKAKLETLFATSNANLSEIFEQFAENGQRTTAPALLNRFQFKAFVYNWLMDRQDQFLLDSRRQQRVYMESLAESDPEVLKHEIFQKPGVLNWVELRQLAKVLIKPNSLFMNAYRKMVLDMRDQTNSAIRESQERHAQGHSDEHDVYFPSADYTERLRQQIPEVIVMSAFLDFLQSPLANDENLPSVTSKQIELDPVSLWRAYLVMTTLGPGKSKLMLDAEQKVDIDFGWTIEPSSARDKREGLLIQNLKAEQERFVRVLRKHLYEIKSNSELAGSNPTPDQKLNSDAVPEESFEFLIHSHLGQ